MATIDAAIRVAEQATKRALHIDGAGFKSAGGRREQSMTNGEITTSEHASKFFQPYFR